MCLSGRQRVAHPPSCSNPSIECISHLNKVKKNILYWFYCTDGSALLQPADVNSVCKIRLKLYTVCIFKLLFVWKHKHWTCTYFFSWLIWFIYVFFIHKVQGAGLSCVRHVTYRQDTVRSLSISMTLYMSVVKYLGAQSRHFTGTVKW